MNVGVNISKIKQTSWKSALIRFGFGGLVTAVTGIITKQFGPVVGGMFLAFPAILPASVTLVEKHDGKRAAYVDTAGCTLGAIALAAFGGVVWGLGPRLSAWLALALAMVVWLAVATGLWVTARYVRHHGRRAAHNHPRNEQRAA